MHKEVILVECVTLLFAFTTVKGRTDTDSLRHVRSFSISAGLGFPEFLTCTGTFQISHYASLGVGLHYSLVGKKDIVRGPGYETFIFQPDDWVVGKCAGVIFTYYFRPDAIRWTLFDLPNALRAEYHYVFKSCDYRDGIMMNYLFFFDDLKPRGFVKNGGFGVTYAKISGLHGFVSLLLKFGVGYNF